MSRQTSPETPRNASPETHEQLGNPEPARAHWPTPDDTEIEMSEATRRQLYRALARLRGRSALRTAAR